VAPYDSYSILRPASRLTAGALAAQEYRPRLGLSLGATSPTEFTLGHNVSSKAEVAAVMQQARNAGAVIVKPAQETFWGGYAGYFQDSDGHLWEVAWNPQWAMQE
jgi:uncharacterized glyoxalase superfamily protein PhnB